MLNQVCNWKEIDPYRIFEFILETKTNHNFNVLLKISDMCLLGINLSLGGVLYQPTAQNIRILNNHDKSCVHLEA